MISCTVAHKNPFSVRRPAVSERSRSRIALAAVSYLSCLTGLEIHDHKPVPVLYIRNFLSIRRIYRSTTIDLIVLEKRFFFDQGCVRKTYIFLADKLGCVDIPYTLPFRSIGKLLSVRREYHISFSFRSISDFLYSIVFCRSHEDLSPADERDLLSVS